MFRKKNYKLCQVKHLKTPKKKLMPGQVNPFSWNDELDSLKYHVLSYGVDFDTEKSINAAIEQAVFDRNFDYLDSILSIFARVTSNIKALTQFVYLQAVCYAYNKEDFHRLLKKFPIDMHEKIDYYANVAHQNDIAPSKFLDVPTYSETLKEFTIRLGAKELTAEIDDMFPEQPEQAVTKKRRI